MPPIYTYAKALEEHGSAFAAYVDHLGMDYASRDWDVTVAEFEEDYAGEWESVADYAHEHFDSTASPEARDMVDQWPFTCIDWEGAGSRLGDIWTADADPPYGVHIFRNR